MAESSKANVTQHARLANPERCGEVHSIKPLASLRQSTSAPRGKPGTCGSDVPELCRASRPKRDKALEAYDPAFRKLSGGAQRLHIWICLEANRRTGFAWGRQSEIAAHLGIHVRTLQLKQLELEHAGFVELRTVRRGNTLPSGVIAKHQTTLFYPTTPTLESLKRYDPELHVIRDLSTKIADPQDLRSSDLTPFCGSDQLEEDGAPPSDREPSTAPYQLKLPTIEELAKHLLRRWQSVLAPHIDLEAPRTRLHRELWVTVIVARLKEGFTSEELEIAIDFVASSPHNHDWERRHVLAVFGEPKRLRTLIEYGLSGASFTPPKAPSSEPRVRRAKTIVTERPPEPEIPMDETLVAEAAAYAAQYEEEIRART